MCNKYYPFSSFKEWSIFYFIYRCWKSLWQSRLDLYTSHFRNYRLRPSYEILDRNRVLKSFCTNLSQLCTLPITLYNQWYLSRVSPFSTVFIFVLEPFLRNICVNPDIAGIFCGTQEHKISAYAEDLLFFLSKPITTLPILLQEFKQCGALSNFYNYQQSEALNLTMPNLCNILYSWILILNGLRLILNN